MASRTAMAKNFNSRADQTDSMLATVPSQVRWLHGSGSRLKPIMEQRSRPTMYSNRVVAGDTCNATLFGFSSIVVK